jgi:nitric oxide reductase large subunit
MQNKSKKSDDVQHMHLKMPDFRRERRKKLRSEDVVYQIAVGLNILAWTLLLSALVVFHYARPEFITGLQNYWGIEGREVWRQEQLNWLTILLETSLLISFFTLIVRARRNRRKADHYGINLLALFILSLISLATIYTII